MKRTQWLGGIMAVVVTALLVRHAMVEGEAMPATAVPAESARTEPRLQAPKPPSVSALPHGDAADWDLVWKALPRRDAIDGLPDEAVAHDAPAAVYEGGEALGRIADALAAAPRLAPRALEFYRRCAAASELHFTARVSCLQNHRYWSMRLGGESRDADFDPELVELAAGLPAVRHFERR